MAIEVQRYAAENASHWDDFLKVSKNGTFLLQRGFMDYHADRFQDHSLMIHEDGKLLAVLPASRAYSMGTFAGGMRGIVRVVLLVDFHITKSLYQLDDVAMLSSLFSVHGGVASFRPCDHRLK